MSKRQDTMTIWKHNECINMYMKFNNSRKPLLSADMSFMNKT